MEKLNKLIFNGEEYLPQKVLLKWIREISDAVNSFSDRGDPIRAQGANKVISLILEKVDAPQEYWKPSEEQINALYNVINPCDYVDKKALESLYEQLKKLM